MLFLNHCEGEETFIEAFTLLFTNVCICMPASFFFFFYFVFQD